MRYAPPEIYRQDPVYNAESAEIYTLGVLLYRMLYRSTPSTRIRFRVDPRVSADAVDLMAWMLHKDCKCRPTIGKVLKHKWLRE